MELGAGTGEAALALAAARPELRVVATEVHKASVATLLLRAHEQAPANLTVVVGDGRDTLAAIGRQRPVDLVRIFFPDPWPKHRHRARRLVGPDLLGLLAEVLTPHGRVELATDDARYAAAARRAVEADPRFRVLGTARADRPVTYYERRALDAGRAVHDLQFGPADTDSPEDG
ncbi:MAG: hypothetical protein R2755_33590 [Acidimicrobiales bacterium]